MTEIDAMLSREVAGYEMKGDGRTVEVLIVPWDKPTEVTDIVNVAGREVGCTYLEQFARGSLSRMAAAPHRVTLTYGHSDGFGDVLGQGLRYDDSAEGAVGTFKLYDATAERAREAIADMGMSLRFLRVKPRAGIERPGQLVTRESVIPRHVAAVRAPAYEDARVLAIRESDEQAAIEAEIAADREQSDAILQAQLEDRLTRLGELPPEMQSWLNDRRALLAGRAQT